MATGWVRSVAFSQDGSRVVSGSNDNTVQIWNMMTGESQLMTTTAITLLDASMVHKAQNGKFHIFYPGQQPTHSIHALLSISDDGQWIVGVLHDCWIPYHDRNFRSSSFFGDRVCLGYNSGHMVILDMKAAP
jgi:WD40 repeat protein